LDKDCRVANQGSHPGQLLSLHEATVGTNVEGKRSEEEDHMKTIRFLVFRALLLIAIITSCFYFLYGQERGHVVPIVRNVAWNDLINQINPEVDEPAKETLGQEIVSIQKFLREHQWETSVGIYDITVFKAIDQARARLQKADKDLETIRNELSYKGEQAKLGR